MSSATKPEVSPAGLHHGQPAGPPESQPEIKPMQPVAKTAPKTAPKTVAISVFKARCLALIEEVNRTGQPLRITRRGKLLAEVVPAEPEARPESWLGRMKGTMDIVGDIMEPTMNLVEWEALQD